MKRPSRGGSGKFDTGSKDSIIENFLGGFLDRHPNFFKHVMIALAIFFVVMLAIILLLKNH
jgi:hypothetical protein